MNRRVPQYHVIKTESDVFIWQNVERFHFSSRLILASPLIQLEFNSFCQFAYQSCQQNCNPRRTIVERHNQVQIPLNPPSAATSLSKSWHHNNELQTGEGFRELHISSDSPPLHRTSLLYTGPCQVWRDCALMAALWMCTVSSISTQNRNLLT